MAAQWGEAPELDEHYDETFTRLFRIFRSRGLAPDDAADSAQEVITGVLVHIGRNGRTQEDLTPLINTITRNVLIERFRKAGRELPAEIDDGDLVVRKDASESVTQNDEFRAVAEAIAGLPTEQQRRAIQLSIDGFSPTDIARELGLSPNATRQLLLRARRHLAATLDAYREELCVRGDLAAAVALLDQSLAIEKDKDERLRLLIQKANYLAEAGLLDQGTELLETCAVLDAEGSHGHAILIERGKIALGQERLVDVHRIVEAIGDPEALEPYQAFEATSLTAGLAAMEGRLNDAETWAVRSRHFAGESERATAMLRARHHYALVLMLKGRLREAREMTRHVYDRHVALRHRKGMIDIGINLLAIYHLCGDLEEGDALGAELLALDPEPPLAGMVLANLSEIKFELGDHKAAEEMCAKVFKLPESKTWWQRTVAHLLLSRMKLAQADAAGAKEHALLAGTEHNPRHQEHELEIETMLMTVAVHVGDEAAVARHGGRAKALVGSASPSIRTWTERLIVMAMSTSDEELVAALADLASRTNSMGVRIVEARTLMTLATLDPANADEHFARARQLFEDCNCSQGLTELAATRAGARPEGLRVRAKSR